MFIFVIIFIPFLLLFLSTRFNPFEYLKCNLTNGSYEGISVPLGAPSAGYACVHTFSDGGKNVLVTMIVKVTVS